METRLKMEQQQKLIMTPQLRQAIAVLQLSAAELTELIEHEMLENPVLEVDEPKIAETSDTEEAVNIADTSDMAEWLEYLDDGFANTRGTLTRDEQTYQPEIVARDEETLEEFLLGQWEEISMNRISEAIGRYLIGCIDENGYLAVSLDEIAAKFTAPLETAAEVLEVVQTLDPAGVGARDLKECLQLQLRRCSHAECRRAELIVADYLDAVAQGRYKKIAEQLKCSLAEVQAAIDLIRSLNPKPGSIFAGEQSAYVIPDITVEKRNGEFVIYVNEDRVPSITVNPYYRQLARRADDEVQRFIEGRIQAAVGLIRSIEQRRRTLHNVMAAIVELQRDFFEYGQRYLRPLNMKMVADRAGIHESTVSRVTANKYAATPQGVVGLRTFFSAGIAAAGGEDVAAVGVKQQIHKLIAEENSQSPLSDQALTDILNQAGIGVSRRTVAKYREELGIPASGKRRRY